MSRPNVDAPGSYTLIVRITVSVSVVAVPLLVV